MSDDFRMHLRLPCEAGERIKTLAAERNQTYIGLVREALGVLQTAHDAGKDGRYLGLTPHRENLETVLVLP